MAAEQRRDPLIREQAAATLRWLEAPGHQLLMFDQAEYPGLLSELSDAPPLLFVEGDPDHHHQVAPDHLGVEQRHVAVNHAFFLQPAHPPQRGGGGQPDFVGQLGVGDAGVALEDSQDLAVGRVEFGQGTAAGHIERTITQNRATGLLVRPQTAHLPAIEK